MADGEPISHDEFERLYRDVGPRLARFLVRQVGDPQLAADLLQEVFVGLLAAPPRRASEREMTAYLYRAAHSRVVDHFRRRKRRGEEALVVEPAASSRSGGGAGLEGIFAQLDSRDRTLLWLAYVEDMRHDEIARALGVGRLSVKVLLFRARGRWKEVLVRNGFGTEMSR